MTAPNPKRQKLGWNRIDQIFADAANVWIIHYSCESFYDRADGRSPRITSIAVRKLDTAQTTSFSIHQVAERRRVPLAEIEGRYDELEKLMLDEFFEHIGAFRGVKYIHWNMRDINFGFAAIEHRYRVLGGNPYVIEEDKKFDLSRLLIDIYGVGYIGHPRLEKLLAKNNIQPLDFLTGAQEAQAFQDRNYVGLHQSTLRKVDVLSNIAGRTHDRNLEVETTWWEMHGGKVRTFLNWLIENPLIAFIASITGIIAFVVWVAGLWQMPTPKAEAAKPLKPATSVERKQH
jgi:hypothetical protein